MKIHLFFFFLLIVLFKITFSIKCGFSQNSKSKRLNETVDYIDMNNGNNTRNLQSNQWKPIRIHSDYSNLNNPGIELAWLEKFKSIVNKTMSIISSLINVKQYPSKLKIQKCDNVNIPDYIKSSGVDSDLILFFTLDYSADASYEAWATSCTYLSNSNRPVAGIVALLYKNINLEKINADEYITNLLLHEFTHVLVFDNNLFNTFVDPETNSRKDINTIIKRNVTINNKNRDLIISEKVVSQAKSHFNCSTIVGVELENQGEVGTSGSHWERRVMNGDYMISQSNDDISISEITLGLFDDSGWYMTNNYTGGLFKYGKNEGCKFLTEKCIINEKPSSKYFCNQEKKPLCLSNRQFKGVCYLSENLIISDINYQYFGNSQTGGLVYADYCPIPIGITYSNTYYRGSCLYGSSTSTSEQGEVIGKSSGCFLSSLYKNIDKTKTFKINQQAICYRYSCNYIEKVIEVFIGNNNSPIICSQEGMKIGISGYSGELICPSFSDMCSSTVICGSISDCAIEKSERVDMSYNNKSIIDNNIIKESNINNSNGSNSSNSVDNSNNTNNINNSETKPVTNISNNTNQNETRKGNSEIFTILLSYYIILSFFIVLL